MPPFEVLFPLGALGLYLLDSCLLLYSNELIYLYRGGRWDFSAAPAVYIAGRRLFVPNPLQPLVPLFRVRWSEHDSRRDDESTAALRMFFATVWPLQAAVMLLLLMLALLPIVIAVRGTGSELLALLAAFYGVIAGSMVYVFVRRGQLGLSRREFAVIAFDCIACAPFAINLVRKLALRRSLAGNPLALAAERFEPRVFAKMISTVCARVDEEQQREYGRTERWAELEAFRQRLEMMCRR